MKQAFIIAVALLLSLAVGPVFAAEGGEKGAGSKAYEHASGQAIFNRLGDWFATVGKSPEEKAGILQERKKERGKNRAEKQVREAQKERERLRRRQTSDDSQMKNRTRVRNKNRIQNRSMTGTKSRGKGKR